MRKVIVASWIVVLLVGCLLSKMVVAEEELIPGRFASIEKKIEESETAWRDENWDEALEKIQKAEEITAAFYPLLLKGPAKEIIPEFTFALTKYKEVVRQKPSNAQCAASKSLLVFIFFQIKDAYWHIYPAAINHIFVELIEIEEAVERKNYNDAILVLDEIRLTMKPIGQLLTGKMVSKEEINNFILLLDQMKKTIFSHGNLREDVDNALELAGNWKLHFIPEGKVLPPARLPFLLESIEEIEDDLIENKYFRAQEELTEMEEDLKGIRMALEEHGLYSDYVLLAFSVEVLKKGIRERKSLEVISFPLLNLEVLLNMVHDKFYSVLPHSWIYLMDEVVELSEAFEEEEWDNAYYCCFELSIIFPVLESQLSGLGVSPEEMAGFSRYIENIKVGLGTESMRSDIEKDVDRLITLLDRWGSKFLNKSK